MSCVIDRLTNDPNLTNAIATIASAFIALLALAVSLVSLYVAWRTISIQREHNVLSVRPIPAIGHADYENLQTVKLINNGPGPLIVTKLSVVCGDAEKATLIDWMPDLPGDMTWGTFAGPLVERSFAAGGELPLLELRGDPANRQYCSARDECRAQLSNLCVRVEFTDIYGTAFPVYERCLAWFGRHMRGGADDGEDEGRAASEGEHTDRPPAA